MEFRPGVVVLNTYQEMLTFCEDFSLYGVVELVQPLTDTNGHALIQAGVVLRPQHLARLNELEGRYEPSFQIALTDTIQKRMREFVIRRLSQAGRRNSATFAAHLREGLPVGLSGLMESALKIPGLVLILYHLLLKDPDFMQQLVNLAILALVIAARHPNPPRYGRRYAFLAGLCADLALGESGAWQFPIIGGAAKAQISRVSARFAAHLVNLPDDVVDAIAGHAVSIAVGSEMEREADTTPASLSAEIDTLIAGDYYRAILTYREEEQNSATAVNAPAGEVATEDAEAVPEPARTDPVRAEFVLQVLRLARYLDDISRRIRDPEEFVEQAVYMIAYNAGRGLFDHSIANPIIAAFEQYRAKAARISRIAALEKECLHPPSALAYPQPLDATQVLCRNRVSSCPHYISSWGMHIVAPINVYGWLGALLEPGEYPKCALGEKLKSLR